MPRAVHSRNGHLFCRARWQAARASLGHCLHAHTPDSGLSAKDTLLRSRRWRGLAAGLPSGIIQVSLASPKGVLEFGSDPVGDERREPSTSSMLRRAGCRAGAVALAAAAAAAAATAAALLSLQAPSRHAGRIRTSACKCELPRCAWCNACACSGVFHAKVPRASAKWRDRAMRLRNRFHAAGASHPFATMALRSCASRQPSSVQEPAQPHSSTCTVKTSNVRAENTHLSAGKLARPDIEVVSLSVALPQRLDVMGRCAASPLSSAGRVAAAAWRRSEPPVFDAWRPWQRAVL